MSTSQKNMALSHLIELEIAIEHYREALNDELSPDTKLALYEEIEALYNSAFGMIDEKFN